MSRSFLDWPVMRQLTGKDTLGRGPAVRSAHTEQITARTVTADRVVKARRDAWQEIDEQNRRVRRTLAIASLGGATLDNEENYLIKKLFTAMGAIQIENQARI